MSHRPHKDHEHKPEHNEIKLPSVFPVRIETTPDDADRYDSENKGRRSQRRIGLWLNWITAVGTLVALVGLFYLWGTMTETKHATAISRDSLILSQRAFVYIGGASWAASIEKNTRQKMQSFIFDMENSGNTPATIDGNYVNSNFFLPKPTWEKLPDNFGFPDNPPGSHAFPNWNSQPSKVIIAPHQAWSFALMPIPESVFPSINQGDAHVYFWGWVSYSDVFGCPHKTEFARELVSAQLIPNKGWSMVIQNVTAHNCADKDCMDYKLSANSFCDEITDLHKED